MTEASTKKTLAEPVTEPETELPEERSLTLDDMMAHADVAQTCRLASIVTVRESSPKSRGTEFSLQ